MPDVEFSISGHVARVHLNRPAALNAITPAMDAMLADAWARVNADDDIRVALLTAEGMRAFCAGADITANFAAAPPIAFGGGLTGIGGPLLTLRKPLVAAVAGHAVGGGFELAMCADVLLIDATARFKLPEVPRGLIDHSGVLHRIVRRLPIAVAMDLILTGRTMDAGEAHRLGLSSRLVPAGELLPAALAVCGTIAQGPPLAMQAAKEAVDLGLAGPLADALGRSYPGIRAFRESDDAQEAARAAVERRPPVWTGR
jgi:crotonobetainyl-CoA hydratase